MDSLLEHDPDILRPPWGAYGRDLTLGVVSSAAKLIIRTLNTLHVAPADLERFQELTMRREPGVGLLTYCNHTSTFDDPGLPSALLPWWMFWMEHSHEKMRWTMCARDVCFKSELLRQFFTNGKTLPVERGSSVHQPVMSVAARLLGGGGWLHVFPEGKVQPAGDVTAFRQGIGKLVCDARAASGRDPVVLPYFHSGMARVMPYLTTLPRAGHDVTVVVGEPVDLSHVTCRCNQPGVNQEEVWRDIAAVLREALLQLEERAPPNPNQLEERPELREIIASRCRRGVDATGRGGSGTTGGGADGSNNGSSGSSSSHSSSRSSSDGSSEVCSSGQRTNLLSAAAVVLAEPCKHWNAWCNVMARPYWAPDQERRQVLVAQLVAQRRRVLPHGERDTAAIKGATLQEGLPPQQQQQPASSRWQRLLRWRQRRAEEAPDNTGEQHGRRGLLRSWPRVPPHQPAAASDAAAMPHRAGAGGWQSAPL